MPITNHTCHQKTNLSRETVPLNCPAECSGKRRSCPGGRRTDRREGGLGTQGRETQDIRHLQVIELTRGPPEVVQHFRYRGSSHRRKSAVCPKFDMVWPNRSPIPVGRRGVISLFKWFLPVFATRRGRGEGGRHPVVVIQSILIPSFSAFVYWRYPYLLLYLKAPNFCIKCFFCKIPFFWSDFSYEQPILPKKNILMFSIKVYGILW